MKYDICGGGVYGLLLALKIKEYTESLEQKTKISIIEKSDSILGNWKNVEISGYKLSAGFHGIEMPRTRISYSLLKNLVPKDSFRVLDNYKLLFINNNTLEFNSSIEKWPKELSKGLKKFHKEHNYNSENVNFDKNILNQFTLGKTIYKCLDRYSPNLNDSWRLFFPWFFPLEFSFNNLDEGQFFQQQVREGKQETYYLQPKNSHFNDLIPEIQRKVEDMGIKIKRNSTINLDEKLNLKTNNNTKKTIWASSSIYLLNINKNKIFNELLQNKRYMHLLLFQIDKTSFKNWLSNFDKLPSEILCIFDNSIGLTRISFPNQDHDEINENIQLIMVEYITKEDSITEIEIEISRKLLEERFHAELIFIGRKFLRPIFISSLEKYQKASDTLKEILISSNLLVPYQYWWPVNMAKCGIEAERVAKFLSNSHKNNG